MTEAVDLPEFQHLSATGVPPADGVAATAPGRHRTGRTGRRHPGRADRPGDQPALGRRAGIGGARGQPLVGHPPGIHRSNGSVEGSLEDDHRRHRLPGCGVYRWRHRPALHRGDRVRRTGRRPVGRCRVHTDGGEQLRVGRGQHHGHRAAGRDPGDVNPFRVDAPPRALGQHAADDPGENGRFTLLAELMPGAEPVPTPLPVVRHRLFRVHHHELMPIGQLVEPGARSEVHRVLGAAVQCQQHRCPRCPAQSERDVHPIGPGANCCGEAQEVPCPPAAAGGCRSSGSHSSAGRPTSLAALAGLRLATAFGGEITVGSEIVAALRRRRRRVGGDGRNAFIRAVGSRLARLRGKGWVSARGWSVIGCGRSLTISRHESCIPIPARHRSGSPGPDCPNERAAVVQVISSSPIRDHSSPGTTKLMIRGVSAIAGRMVCIAVMK